jgi:hypothetical protein
MDTQHLVTIAFSAEILGGLANHLEFADYTVLNQTRGQEGFFTGGCVLIDPL